MPVHRGMDKEDTVHLNNGILLGHKENDMLSLATTWMGLENIILSEVSCTEKDRCYLILLICGI